ncbi:Holliday junction branch migration protein RuvA [Virgibacillus sp. W0430]|uniref:Holliday junction branch migration protein RuvA n=1 Tax=Virgibacillus sp. W0430 TaxID=3391580 RepID=UPI003F45D55C
MISYVKGVLTFIADDTITVDVNGIGYEILCSNPFSFQQILNKEIFVYTYHHIREDVQQLYGFKTEDEKRLFTKLISVSGIGPKSGIAILGSIEVNEFIQAIEQEDEKYLTSFPGVGKKTARQIILDLKGKLTGLLRVGSVPITDKETEPNFSIAMEEAFAALKALGYTDRELRSIKPNLLQINKGNTDEIIKNGLALLMKS